MNPRSVNTLPRLPVHAKDANKGSRGKVAIVGGSRGMAGAPCLAARGACRGGAGLVRVIVPESIWDIAATKLDECLTDGAPATAEGAFSAAAFDRVFEKASWADVVAIGPGMSQASETGVLIQRLIAELNKPLVLDADALNALQEGRITVLQHAQQKYPSRPVVLTPHPGEMSRLLGVEIRAIQANRAKAAQTAVELTGAVVVLKGAGTVVCDGKRKYINTTGNPGMATGGTGDVLSGIIGALLGQKIPAFEAACLGVHLHGLAGDLAAKQFSQWSMTAGDLVEALPAAFLKYSSKRQR